jgi:adenosylcobinamide-GDP ribazoletransferase
MLSGFWTLFCTALTFLTRLPLVARYADPAPAALARSAVLWPAIGALIGLSIAVVLLISTYWLSAAIAAWLAILAGLLLTGAFHEDGLADSFDGLWGGYSPERRMEIMKDSRIGTYGALALIVLVGLKSLLLAELADAAPIIMCASLMAAHALARASVLPLTRWLPYVRAGADNKPVAEAISTRIAALGLALSVLLLLALLSLAGFGALGSIWFSAVIWTLMLLLWLSCAAVLRRKLGGVTGDTLGAVNQLTEIAVLLLACGFLRFKSG